MQLENTIEKTRCLLESVRRHGSTRNIGLQVHRGGAGVVRVQIPWELAKRKEPPPAVSEDEVFVLIDIRELLRAWLASVKKIPRRKRQNPGRTDKDAIAFYGQEFFQRYSPDDRKKCPEFLERFLEVAHNLSTEYDQVSGKMDWQSRKLQKALRETNTPK
jgi:hypothetical protein